MSGAHFLARGNLALEDSLALAHLTSESLKIVHMYTQIHQRYVLRNEEHYGRDKYADSQCFPSLILSTLSRK
jgi:hypothetical protein